MKNRRTGAEKWGMPIFLILGIPGLSSLAGLAVPSSEKFDIQAETREMDRNSSLKIFCIAKGSVF